MRISILIFSLLISTVAYSAGAPTQNVLKNTYENYQYTGIAVGNHSSIQSLRSMDQFILETISSDPEFKYVFVEGPMDIQQALIEASIGQLTISELEEKIGPYWMVRIRFNPQWNQLVYGSLPIIQAVNRLRPDNPIKMVAIDSYTQPRSELDESMIKNQIPGFYFGGSISREILTAENFLEFEKANAPGKGLVYYHQAHILKNLNADGYESNSKNELVEASHNHLGWVGFVEDTEPGFYDRLGVVLFNEKDESMNPSGVIDLSHLPQPFEEGTGSLAKELPTLSSDTFYILEDAFLGRYRSGSVLFPEDARDTFDAFVNY